MKLKLKALLCLALPAVVLIPAAAVVLMGINSSRTQAVTMMAEEVRTISYAQSGGIEVLMNDCKSTLRTIKLTDEVIKASGGDLSEENSEHIKKLFENYKEANDYIKDIIVTDSNGVIQPVSLGERSRDLFHALDKAQELTRDEIHISDITRDDDDYDGESTFFILGRTEDKDGNLMGYVSVVFSTEVFTDYLVSCDFFKHGDLFITDRAGTALWLGSENVTPLGNITPPALRNIVNENVQKKEGSLVNLMEIGDESFVGAFGQIGGQTSSGWYWYGVYPSSQIDVLPLPIQIIVFIVCGITLVSLIIMFVLIHRITFPLRDMVKKIRRINEGEMSERLEAKGLSEYAYISETFNEMMNEVTMSGEMHRTISEISDNMLFEWDYKKEVLYVSDNLLAMFDIKPERASLLNGRFIESLMEKEESDRYKMDIDKMHRTKEDMNGEYQVTTKFGSIIWISVRAHCVTDRLGNLLRVIGVITNINNEKMLSIQLAERASYDFLSGLYNRNTFMRQLDAEIERHVNSRVGLIFIDVDDFKLINDNYGHDTGDEVIRCVAKIIKEELGTRGFAGRFGGDEFVMCVTDAQLIDHIGEGLARNVLTLFERGYYSKPHNATLKIKASLGIAIAPDHGRTGEAIIAAADESMYYVKKNGKSNYRIYDPNESAGGAAVYLNTI